MASKETADGTLHGKMVAVAIVVPTVFAFVVILLLTTAFVLPRFGRGGKSFSALQQERMKIRLEEIDKVIKTQNYCEWRSTQEEKDPDGLLASDPLCAICLDHFTQDAQIRGLGCSHAFHTHCLDEWFARFNEYCPLCHRTIIPGRKVVKKKIYTLAETMPVAYIV
ncbi:hypothetical protein ACEQ8H_001733 [Pleosporales sp. CAS-2024a]